MKILINRCYGGFSLSETCFKEAGFEWDGYGYNFSADVNIRVHPEFIRAFEKLGTKVASGDHSEIKLIEIPDDVNWTISDYDGMEEIHEYHRTWS